MQLLKEENFLCRIDNKEVRLYTLHNKNGYIAQFTNYGARWLSMWTPDKSGDRADVILGFDSLDGYLNAKEKYYGAIVGRTCGRIARGTFPLKGKTFSLSNNDLFGEPVKNHLHGGEKGFSFQVWEGCPGKNKQDEEFLELHYLSKDGEEGYPGNLQVKVTYTLGNDNTLRITYSAITDKTTIVTMTNHAYFNLNNNKSRDVLDHLLVVNADHFIENNSSLTPTGKIIPVINTPLDFNGEQAIRYRIHQAYTGQLIQGEGYVVSYVLPDKSAVLKFAARVKEKESGRIIEVYTDQPILQFYNGWLLDGTDIGKNKQHYYKSSGLALEAQSYPDAPNHHHFPSIVLNPHEIYSQQTIYRFLVSKKT